MATDLDELTDVVIALDERPWTLDAACARTGLPEMWSSDCEQARIALHICRTHCPVRVECAADAARAFGTDFAFRDVVIAGTTLGGDGRALTQPGRQVPAAACWLCSELAVRPSELTYRDQTRTPSDGACGTQTGYRRHTARRERHCDPCRAWRRDRYQAAVDRREAMDGVAS